MISVNLISAFLGGILTFLAPCTLPLIPAYIGFLAGGVKKEDSGSRSRSLRLNIFLNALLFTIGFSVIFIFFGTISGTIGKFFILHRATLASVGGVFVIFFGVMMLGFIPTPRLFGGSQLPAMLRPGNPYSAFLLGILFALGWSPCLGPVLGTILLLASTSGTAFQGGLLLFVYSLGLAIPFLLVATLYGSAFTYVVSLGKYLPMISKAAGIFFILIGVLLILGQFGMLNIWAAPLLESEWYNNAMQYM